MDGGDGRGGVAPQGTGPVLVDRAGRFRLRPWGPDDAPALVAAWAVPDVADRSRAPGDRSIEAAARWIDGAEVRVAAGLAVDLVVAPSVGPAVWGEVGLVRRRWRPADGGDERTVHEVGWWVLPEHRGQGLAAAATGVLGRWARAELGVVTWVARIGPAHLASQRVADRLGLARRGRFDDDHDLWVGPVPGG